jgi:fumarate reductase subunit C
MEHYSWFLRQSRYRNYMLREATAIIVAVYCCLILAALLSVGSDNSQNWNDFLARQQHPGWLAWHVFSLGFLIVFQTIPWFRLAPRAMPLQLGEWSVPPALILGLHYAGWVFCSLFVLFLAGVF